ncbi:carbonic anhydrase [Pseudonocardia sp. RS11V-5]|nr:carbonic anhydrase [Pseudonocardia terrae]
MTRHAERGAAASAEAAKGLPAPPSLHTLIVTCMDARIDPVALFGIEPGEAHVLRNAGGIVTDDVVRSVTISQRELGTRTVYVVQHKGCGMGTFTDPEFVAKLQEECGATPDWAPGAFSDAFESVRQGVARLVDSPFTLPEMRVKGFVLDLETFALEPA